ncbi:DEAD/DEAH box helicase family protein [Bacillus sp. DJP31]|uniref:DEAD/DEAH box helicase family protein n=1 Tax=Bacillus sp. DJP31 TaxID=3409789 RepID=UPI003BB4E975
MSNSQLITTNLVHELRERIQEADSIYILSSFSMTSGVRMLVDSLKEAASRGADIKVCTGDYLFITQPEALTLLNSIHPNLEIRLWRSNGVSFHPKAYLFHYDKNGTIIIGSSNLSKSALTTGIEWNALLKEGANQETFDYATKQFIDIFYSEHTVAINSETIKHYQQDYDLFHQKNPQLAQKMTELEELALMYQPKPEELPTQVAEEGSGYDEIAPRFAQVDALEQLGSAIEEGYSSAMVVMATGLGKTYLAGFFSQRYKRVLFIAHREEILGQARLSFNKVNPNNTYGIYNGHSKESNADVIFASIQTLSMKRHLEVFSHDEFDLIIVDEFHHAAADSYQRVLNYFQPEFLLGITATPDRADNKDVYAICHGNVAYRIDFIEAIQQHWLSPFHYVGVYDETDYSQITWLGAKYNEQELLAVQLKEEMAEKILEAWNLHKQTRTIGFCSSIRQANFLSDYFTEHGYRSISLHSRSDIPRENAIQQLDQGELDIIFTVDLFNEGVDIPSVDTVLFVRPTESLTVFTQQIGRGLRLHPEKEKCVIIDLIGNYRNADYKLSLFNIGETEVKKGVSTIPQVPVGCVIDLDIRVINLIKELSLKHQPRKQKLLSNYRVLKEELGKRPSYLELHLKGSVDVNEYKQEFKTYIGFLVWADELTSNELDVYNDYKNWLSEVEKTGMAKSYKMVVLNAMLKRGKAAWYNSITPQEIAPGFHRYLTEKDYRKKIDFSDKESKRLWEYDEEKVSSLISRMPMSKWSGSSKGLVVFEKNVFSIKIDVKIEHEQTLFEWTKQICEYRLQRHFERKGMKQLN